MASLSIASCVVAIKGSPGTAITTSFSLALLIISLMAFPSRSLLLAKINSAFELRVLRSSRGSSYREVYVSTYTTSAF